MKHAVRVLCIGVILGPVMLGGCGRAAPTPGRAPESARPEAAMPPASARVLYSVCDNWASVQKLYQFSGEEAKPVREGGLVAVPQLYPHGLWSDNTTPIVSAHPAYAEKTGQVGDMILRFEVRLPDRRTRLVFGAGLSSGAGLSDGVQFRITVDQASVFDEVVRVVEPQFKWFRWVDLTPYAGREVTIDMVTTPGPKDNVAYDWALWEDPKIVG